MAYAGAVVQVGNLADVTRWNTQTDGIKHSSSFSTESASFTQNHLASSRSLAFSVHLNLRGSDVLSITDVQCLVSILRTISTFMCVCVCVCVCERDPIYSESEQHRYTRCQFAMTKRLEVVQLQWRLAIWSDTSNSDRWRSEQRSALC